MRDAVDDDPPELADTAGRQDADTGVPEGAESAVVVTVAWGNSGSATTEMQKLPSLRTRPKGSRLR